MSAVALDAFVHDLATRSGEAILPFFRTAIGVEDKGRRKGQSFDPVTEADRAAEQVMRRMITTTFPEHGIIGEEFGNERRDADYVWALDPIDGTKSFISGMPAWGTLIGLLKQGAPVYGMMHQPFIGERFFGDGGSAHYLGPAGKRRLLTRDCGRLEDAILFTTSPLLMNAADRTLFQSVERDVRLSRYGGDCYAYCMVAAGLVDLVIETGLQDHDIVALVPVIEGAGGIVTNWEGGSPVAGGRVVAAGSKAVHEQALKRLNP
ncbi:MULTISPECIES: histidinol-phosphatase [Azorhizobium]|uniref:Histidinol-phosphatase n=1 Tax=Azorhizobium caulinodans (strain ATCC 43989 / DSM 5975 / JCM 20966 / LMG 6465 / NBRC 14845 / NCIMB 13405 / ORS 571) TaxID=438753 RepID=A8HV53_AZOC5|nr:MULTISPECIES: histidinol-phosphatase [Azorhizobium]TDT89444.1 myo-inositol-1(or 4)-monophosphatase [Azorhizobium sp. AG788]BAF90266.1 putative histidinol-phosphate phosphatase [Azorhizobium caulinodans ORS 571]